MPYRVEAIYDGGVLRPLTPVNLKDGQKVRISIERTVPELAPASHPLPEWTQVYEGLTDREIATVEKIALDRSHFMTPSDNDQP
jgi:predicted DNA-binding antitoxin AbrB/MazE fold protein